MLNFKHYTLLSVSILQYVLDIWKVRGYIHRNFILPREILLIWDILFLLPVSWIAPVIAPILISILMIILALVIYHFNLKVILKYKYSSWRNKRQIIKLQTFWSFSHIYSKTISLVYFFAGFIIITFGISFVYKHFKN